MRFAELSTNKMTILMKLISSDEIVKCLINNQSNFLDIEIPVDFDRSSLIYQNLYPHHFIPTVETEAKTFITIRLAYKPNGMTFKIGSIWFYIITHNSLIRTDYGFLRYDYLINKIDEIFNSSEDLGFDKLAFNDMDEFIVNENYGGVYILYKTQQFQ